MLFLVLLASGVHLVCVCVCVFLCLSGVFRTVWPDAALLLCHQVYSRKGTCTSLSLFKKYTGFIASGVIILIVTSLEHLDAACSIVCVVLALSYSHGQRKSQKLNIANQSFLI